MLYIRDCFFNWFVLRIQFQRLAQMIDRFLEVTVRLKDFS